MSSGLFRVEHILGSGGSGAVYKAWHQRLKKHVVVKEVRHSLSDSIGARRNEVEALKNMKNAYLPQVLDFLAEGDRVYTVMEYIEGESFDKILRQRRRFASSQAAKWYMQLASALEAIHEQDVCHRDIKPSNIMLSPRGDICLIDFSAALVRGNNTQFISHSRGYASPEQYDAFRRVERAMRGRTAITGDMPESAVTEFAGIPDITEFAPDDVTRARVDPGIPAPAPSRIDWKRSDIYSLGATMYHIMTGKRPPTWVAEDNSINVFGGFGGHLAHIVEKSMRRDPSERFGSASELISGLAAARATTPAD